MQQSENIFFNTDSNHNYFILLKENGFVDHKSVVVVGESWKKFQRVLMDGNYFSSLNEIAVRLYQKKSDNVDDLSRKATELPKEK